MNNTILVFLLLLSVSCFSQEVPNHTWKIVVNDSLTADQNIALVTHTLMVNDFAIENKETQISTIQSGLKHINNSNATYFFKFAIKPGVIEVTGEWNTNTAIYLNGVKSESTFGQIENRGGRIGEVFEIMKNFALKLGGSPTYIFD